MYIETPGRELPATGAKAFTSAYDVAVTFAMTMAPLLAMILPFLKTLAAKAVEDDVGDWSDLAKRLASRLILVVAALVMPLFPMARL